MNSIKRRILERIGDMCRTYRKERNLTLKEVAEKYGITESGVSRIENGESNNLIYFLFARNGFSWDELIRIMLRRNNNGEKIDD